jgi:hypothetical protein
MIMNREPSQVATAVRPPLARRWCGTLKVELSPPGLRLLPPLGFVVPHKWRQYDVVRAEVDRLLRTKR